MILAVESTNSGGNKPALCRLSWPWILHGMARNRT